MAEHDQVRRAFASGETRGLTLTLLLGVGAMRSPRHGPGGLLIESPAGRVAIDGGPGAEPPAALDAWSDGRGVLRPAQARAP